MPFKSNKQKAKERRKLAQKKMVARKRQLILGARKDPAKFVAYCFRHEKTGKIIRNEGFHETWHEFLTGNRWSVLVSPIEHGKTVQIGLGRVLWEMGTDPNVRVLLIGESKRAAKKLLRGIKIQIERNPRVREVFPELRPSEEPGDPWTDEDIIVQRSGLSRDPTVQARGVGSENILGSRLDIAVLDDVLNMENTSTKTQRDKIEEWFDTTVFTRLQDEYDASGTLIEGGKVYVIGTPWNRDDLLHRLKARKKWGALHFSAVTNPHEHPAMWKPLWPAIWPRQRILDKRDGMTETAFVRKVLCQVMIDQMRRFKDAWLRHMFALGKGRTMLDRAPRGYNGKRMRCVTGVDIGVGKKRKDAKTVIFTIAIDDRSRRRIVVDIEGGRWDGPEIVSKIAEKNRRYDSVVVVESNAAQKFISQYVRNEGVPTYAHHTSRSNKYDEEFGVESLAVEMRAGLWVAPSGKDGVEIDPELQAWKADMENYDPELHTGDYLMASWFAREGARKFGKDRHRQMNHMNR